MDAMDWIGAVFTIFSGIGAWKSCVYYKKSKHITKFANTNISYIECKKIMDIFLQLLQLVNNDDKEMRGINIRNSVKEYGTAIINSIDKIKEIIPSKEWSEVNNLLNGNDINVDRYISSLVTGSVLVQDKFIDTEDFYKCRSKFAELQELIKKQGEKLEEKLK